MKTTEAIKDLVEFITTELQQGRSVSIPGLGKFGLKHIRWYSTVGKVGKHKTPVVRVHPEADYPVFKASPKLRKAIHQVRIPDYGKPTDKLMTKHEEGKRK